MQEREAVNSSERGSSRREFLGAAACTGTSLLLGAGPQVLDDPPLYVPPGHTARVVRAESPRVVQGTRIHLSLLEQMIANAMMGLTGRRSMPEAWHELFSPNDVIGIKFNRSGQQALGTTKVLAEVILSSLIEAGFEPGRIVCIEAPREVEEKFGTARPWPGYDEEPTDFGSGRDRLASVLRQVTALICVPFAKSHNLTRFTGCLKNLSHGLTKHPARYHRNGCDPYIADIVALPAIRSKLRLCLMDALRVVFDGGPEPSALGTRTAGVVFASQDPVAVDAAGAALLDEVRRKEGLPLLVPAGSVLPYLATAHRKSLGIALPRAIKLERVSA